MTKIRTRNTLLEAALAEAGWSYGDFVSALRAVARESSSRDCDRVNRSHVSHWVNGTVPSGRAPELIAETFCRRLGRQVPVVELGFPSASAPTDAEADWNGDTLALLAALGSASLDTDDEMAIARRDFVTSAAVYAAAIAAAASGGPPAGRLLSDSAPVAGGQAVGHGDVRAVADMIQFFSALDQRHGGGHARTAMIHYLKTDVAGFLKGRYREDSTRQAMFSAASELSYLVGWTGFDDGLHGQAQRYYLLAIKLAGEAGDPPMAAHTLRAMAHQAVDLGQGRQALALGEASVTGERYRLAGARERALLRVVHARGLAATGQALQAAAELSQAEADLSQAGDTANDPQRIWFFGEASLSNQTALTLRDIGDLTGAQTLFERAAKVRPAGTFTRTHAITLAHLGDVQSRLGAVEEACATWNKSLDAMEGLRSARARDAVARMRSSLTPFSGRRIPAVAALDTRAAAYLKGTSV